MTDETLVCPECGGQLKGSARFGEVGDGMEQAQKFCESCDRFVDVGEPYPRGC